MLLQTRLSARVFRKILQASFSRVRGQFPRRRPALFGEIEEVLQLLSPLDLRRLGPEALEPGLRELGPEQARIVQSRRSLADRLVDYTAWPLVNGPSAFYYLVHRPRPPARPVLDLVREQHRQIVTLYRQAVAQESDGTAFEALLSRHMETEEKVLYPIYTRWVQDERLIRELGYEHLGLRRGLPAWLPFVRKIRAGETTRRERDGFDIEFFHLFEHHMKREEESLLPVLEHLCPDEAARAAEEFTWAC